MKTELIDHSQTRKEIKINIDAADVRSEYDRVSDLFARQAAVPGFRPGRAPREVVRRHYKNEIRTQVLRDLLPQAVSDAIEEHQLNPLFEPNIQLENTEGLEQLGQQPLLIQAEVEVFPTVELNDYKGVEVTRRVRPVGDDVVERIVENLRERSASLQPVEEDRGAQNGDTVSIQFHGKFVGEGENAEEDFDAEDDVVLGGPNMLPEFTDNLLGIKADEERAFSVTYPAEFGTPSLAGRTIEYTARATDLRYTELPEMNDEWVQSVDDEAKTVAELRQLIRQRVETAARLESDGRLRDELIGKLVAANPFELPATLVERQAQETLRATLYEMMSRGFDPRRADLPLEALREATRERAERELRGSFLIDQVARDAQIEVSAEDEEAEVQRLAAASEQTPEQVRAALTKEGGERSIADRLRVRRTLDFLVENARIVDGEWREEDDEVAADGDEATAAPEEVAAADSPDDAASENEAKA